MARTEDILDCLREPEIAQFPDFTKAIRDLVAQVENMKSALRPFVEMADSWDESEPDSTMMDFHEADGSHINLGHCRKARSAYFGEAA